jgi:tRNA (guanine37-N1)-methyltransferase
MRFDIITLFPGMVRGPLAESILKRAMDAGKIQVLAHDLLDWAEGRHRQADDAPFGGGDGMVMKPEPLVAAIRAIKAQAADSLLVLLTPQGRTFTQELATEWAKLPGLILVCGHYAGMDERAREAVGGEELSIGDYVISSGELAALVVVEAVARQVPGVLGNEVSAEDDSFPGRLEYPQYTRPAEFEGRPVPEVLLSGHHREIARWRKKESLRRTLLRRPDLLAKCPPDAEEKELLAELEEELGGISSGGSQTEKK